MSEGEVEEEYEREEGGSVVREEGCSMVSPSAKYTSGSRPSDGVPASGGVGTGTLE